MVDKSEKLKAYETTILQRVECERKAFDIVNRLVEDTVVGDYLVQCGHLISREHYYDIVEERAITMICGYPVCSNTLQNIPKKRFQISTKSNKVYDISERKKFCSNQCLKASLYFCNQIPESPLWAREKEILPEIKLFPQKLNTGLVGVEVVGESPSKNLKEELSKIEDLDKKMSLLSLSSNLQDQNKKSVKETFSYDDPVTDSGTKSDPLILKDKCTKTKIIADKSNTKILRPDPNINSQTVKSSKDTSEDTRVLAVITSQEETVPDTSVGCNIVHDSLKIKTASKKNVCDPCVGNSAQKPESKLEQLHKILSRRKGVLSEMIVDMQPTLVTQAQCSSKKDCNNIQPQDIVTPQSDSLPFQNELREYDADIVSSLSCQKELRQCKADNMFSLSCQKELRGCKVENLFSDNKQLTSEGKKVFSLPLQHITNALKTWMTDETSAYLLPSPNESKENMESLSDPRLQKDYAQLCRRLDMQEKEFDNLMNGIGDNRYCHETRLKSVPNYELLNQETEKFQLKVVEFITGKKPETLKASEKTEDDSTNPVFLPIVDTYDQQQIRMKIVLYQLDKIMPSLLTPLSQPVQLVSTLIRELSSTFRLQKDTIVFNPSEWTLVGIFILKMLSKKSKVISEAFSGESAVRYFSILLSGIGHKLEDFDQLTNEILSCCSNKS